MARTRHRMVEFDVRLRHPTRRRGGTVGHPPLWLAVGLRGRRPAGGHHRVRVVAPGVSPLPGLARKVRRSFEDDRARRKGRPGPGEGGFGHGGTSRRFRLDPSGRCGDTRKPSERLARRKGDGCPRHARHDDCFCCALAPAQYDWAVVVFLRVPDTDQRDGPQGRDRPRDREFGLRPNRPVCRGLPLRLGRAQADPCLGLKPPRHHAALHLPGCRVAKRRVLLSRSYLDRNEWHLWNGLRLYDRAAPDRTQGRLARYLRGSAPFGRSDWASSRGAALWSYWPDACFMDCLRHLSPRRGGDLRHWTRDARQADDGTGTSFTLIGLN